MQTREGSIRLKKLQDVECLLIHLSQLAREQINASEKNLRQSVANSCRLYSFPDELLHLIFSHVEQETGISLNQFSRRIRSIALGTADLWTTICSCQPLAHNTAFLRSAARKPTPRLNLCFRERATHDLEKLKLDMSGQYVDLAHFMKPIASLSVPWYKLRFEHRPHSSEFELVSLIEREMVPFSPRSVEKVDIVCLDENHKAT